MDTDNVRRMVHEVGYKTIRDQYMERSHTLDDKIYWTYEFIDFMMLVMITDILDYQKSIAEELESYQLHKESDVFMMKMIVACKSFSLKLIHIGSNDDDGSTIVERIELMDNMAIITRRLVEEADKRGINGDCHDHVVNALNEFDGNINRLSNLLTLKLSQN